VNRTAARAGSALVFVCFSAALCVAAWWLQGWTPRSPAVTALVRSEITHVIAHVILYGALFALTRRMLGDVPGRRAAAAAGLTLLVACAQEMVQVRTYGGTFLGRGEWFDLAVDAIAIAVVEGWKRFRQRRSIVTEGHETASP
jgi:hypothetical protein